MLLLIPLGLIMLCRLGRRRGWEWEAELLLWL